MQIVYAREASQLLIDEVLQVTQAAAPRHSAHKTFSLNAVPEGLRKVQTNHNASRRISPSAVWGWLVPGAIVASPKLHSPGGPPMCFIVKHVLACRRLCRLQSTAAACGAQGCRRCDREGQGGDVGKHGQQPALPADGNHPTASRDAAEVGPGLPCRWMPL